MRRSRTLPLRSRLALLVAAAVAIAVAAVSAACWFIVRGKLYDEVDSDLHAQNSPIELSVVRTLLENCSQTPSGTAGEGFVPRPVYYFQLVKSDGTACVFANSAGRITVDSSDTDVADRPDPNVETYRDGTDSDGTPVRVLTIPVVGDGPARSVVDDTAVMIAFPLQDTRNTLNYLALLLLAVSGIGAIGAGGAGLWVARSGLRPVDRLADTVEHVARTEDLTVRIPVDGDDEIARLSQSFNAMTGALASSRELQQQLIADAGHELRTPLTSLRTNIELLARSDETGRAIPPADRKALMTSVKAQMTELALLIGDLQELSRPGASEQGPLKVVALHTITRAALDRARLRGPELTINAELAPWYVRAEPAALERAVVNILDNAVKFSPRAGTVDVRLHLGELTVRDHGPGITEEDLPHVFDRFWRSSSARSLPGSGLGLSIVARTVEACGGEVALRPADGGGTVATLRLPGAATPPPEIP